MKALKSLAVLMVFVLLTAVACKKTEEVVTGEAEAPATTTEKEIAGISNPNDLSPMSAQAYIDDVTIGHKLAADGTIPAGQTGDDFAPGQVVHIAMRVKDAPAGSAVKVAWFAPGETRIGDEQKNVPAGATTLTFSSPSTKGWAKGDYRAEVWIGDEKVNTQQFQIVDASKAGK